MRAKAALLTLLICMISFAGIGFSTPDPVQDSKTVLVSYDTKTDNVENKIVVKNKSTAESLKIVKKTKLKLTENVPIALGLDYNFKGFFKNQNTRNINIYNDIKYSYSNVYPKPDYNPTIRKL